MTKSPKLNKRLRQKVSVRLALIASGILLTATASAQLRKTKTVAAIPIKRVATTIETQPDGSTKTTTTTTTTQTTTTVTEKKPQSASAVQRRIPSLQQSSPDAFTSTTYLPYKKRLLEIMGTAKERVVLGSSLLADSEVVSFLYLAKYRGLKVTVILDPRYARARTSRLPYLRKNQIPTMIHSLARLPLQQDFLKVDMHSYSLTGFLAPQFVGKRRYEIYKEPIYVDAKLDAMLAALKAPKPRVPFRDKGRRGGRRLALPSGGETIPAEGYNYNYGARQTKAPPGMATALPRRTIADKAARGAKAPTFVPRPVANPDEELLYGPAIEGEQPLIRPLPDPTSSTEDSPADAETKAKSPGDDPFNSLDNALPNRND